MVSFTPLSDLGWLSKSGPSKYQIRPLVKYVEISDRVSGWRDLKQNGRRDFFLTGDRVFE